MSNKKSTQSKKKGNAPSRPPKGWSLVMASPNTKPPQSRPRRKPKGQSDVLSRSSVGFIAKNQAFVNRSLSMHIPLRKEFLGTFPLQIIFGLVARFRCNPGSFVTHPWLSRIALNFERYRYRRLKFIAVTRQSINYTGNAILSPDYDSADAAQVTESQMMNEVDAIADAPWKNLELVLSPARMNESFKAHNVMSDGRFASTKQDAKTIDVASVTFAGYTNNLNPLAAYSLWVEYELDLFDPQTPTEEPFEGAVKLNAAAVQANAGGTLPIFTSVGAQIVSALPADPIINPTIIGTATNTVGTFARDFSGIAETVLTGTAITGVNAGTPVIVAGVGQPNAAGSGPVINAASTQAIYTQAINALAGDTLSYNNVDATLLTNVLTRFSGFPASII